MNTLAENVSFNVVKKRDFKSDNSEESSKIFTLSELKYSIDKANDRAPWADENHYQRLKDLPYDSLNLQLEIFNKFWFLGSLDRSHF